MEKDQKEYVHVIDGGGSCTYSKRDMVIVGYIFISPSSCMEHACFIGSMIDYFLS